MWLRHGIRKVTEGRVSDPEVGREGRHVSSARLDRVLAEAIAVIEGTVVDSVVCGWPPPPGAWVNKLAHADWDEICALSNKHHRPGWVWERATSFLAAEMRTVADTPAALLDLQSGALIPLELEILAHRVEPPESPADLIEMVTAEIRRYHR